MPAPVLSPAPATVPCWGCRGQGKHHGRRDRDESISESVSSLQEWQLRRRFAGTAGGAGEETPSSEAPRKLRGSDPLRPLPQGSSSPRGLLRKWPDRVWLAGGGALRSKTVCLQLLHLCPECGSSIQQFTSLSFGDN
ncbi:hypothetical protein NDU88_009355 [Pleurodeles waltl]|uniref:Uncharacterized protein n=1 Tax=Pleurodeles waltl TaxID=8319 RepID=A0AAV7P1R7_PLEWA|nr:hypothetical protein NDU88_009355 [Pleurodeles waltl]